MIVTLKAMDTWLYSAPIKQRPFMPLVPGSSPSELTERLLETGGFLLVTGLHKGMVFEFFCAHYRNPASCLRQNGAILARSALVKSGNTKPTIAIQLNFHSGTLVLGWCVWRAKIRIDRVKFWLAVCFPNSGLPLLETCHLEWGGNEENTDFLGECL